MASDKITLTLGGNSISVNGPASSTDVAVLPNWVSDQAESLDRWSYRGTITHVEQWTMSLSNLPKQQWLDLQNFFYKVALGPLNQFTYTHTDGVVYSARFIDGQLSAKRESSKLFATTLRLELLGQQVNGTSTSTTSTSTTIGSTTTTTTSSTSSTSTTPRPTTTSTTTTLAPTTTTSTTPTTTTTTTTTTTSSSSSSSSTSTTTSTSSTDNPSSTSTTTSSSSSTDNPSSTTSTTTTTDPASTTTTTTTSTTTTAGACGTCSGFWSYNDGDPAWTTTSPCSGTCICIPPSTGWTYDVTTNGNCISGM